MTRTALTNVRVFDGERLTEPTTVVIDGGVLGTDASGAHVVDADGGVLLPGLIDSHLHLRDRSSLEQLRAHGVTTALDMATWPAERLSALRDQPGLPDVRSPGLPAIGPGGMHAKVMNLPAEAIVQTPEQAREFVAARVAERVDYLKMVAEPPGEGGPGQDVLNELVAQAHAHGLRVVAHAARSAAVTMVIRAGADVITHTPLDVPMTADDVAAMAAGGRISVPTLTVMEIIANHARRPGASFAPATGSVTAMHKAGVPILAGTDAHAQPGLPFAVELGASLHHELELLVGAGLSTAAALRAATSVPAKHFGLADRGAVRPGLRADLVLIDGDPLADIRATRTIRGVWCAGVAAPRA